MIKPNRLKVTLIRINRKNIHTGCKIFKFTKKLDVNRIIIPTITDFEAAAQTQPTVISKGEIGAESISQIVPLNLGKNIPNEELEIL